MEKKEEWYVRTGLGRKCYETLTNVSHPSENELGYDPKFVHHFLSHTTVTGGNESENTTSQGGRMDGSVNIRTTKRVSNDVKSYHDKDYEED